MWVRKTGEDAPTSRQSWPVFLDGGQQDTELGLGGGWGWGGSQQHVGPYATAGALPGWVRVSETTPGDCV